MKIFKSNISNKEYPESEIILAKNIRPSIFEYIKIEHPDFNKQSKIAIFELNRYRQKYLENYLLNEAGELSKLELDVLASIEKQELITANSLSKNEEAKGSFGQQLADKVASFGGSWKFIILFSLIIFIWITANIVLLANKGFDPYPFILLNLILSCLAALQAPVIMMSQNRQEEKDRERAKQDYMINLKAELEIRTLHEKLDHLIIHQQQELLNIQKIQVEMMEDIMKKINTKK
ncbi:MULTISPECIES: DUF1003 domain-containing protein [unclassified Maribacter]|uniref:DUF1003 domain-containing protein n=1 Tax=unclassified Maribacter TaxID=2615042 RepID=UPI00257C50BC|nr:MULTISPECIES: DUF1003 domain-containing protein [unclassified Maribacter]|tara:strand:+ start:65833 stop:66537 length:705 start_codon:yes stop_codon:yes gene_type:complete